MISTSSCRQGRQVWNALFLPVCLIVAVMAACSKPGAPAPGGPVAFQAGEAKVSASDVDTFVRMNMPARGREELKTPEGRKKLIEAVETMVVFGEKGRRAGLDKTPEYQAMMRISEYQILAKLFLEKEVADKCKVSDAEALAYYNSHQDQFQGDRVKVRHILVKDPAAAMEILRAVQADPAAFAVQAAKVSLDSSSRDKGGELGWLERNGTAPEFEKAVFAAPVGIMNQPVRSRFGFHIVEVQDKQSGVRPFPEVKEMIVQGIQKKKQAEMFDKTLESSKKEIPVKEFPAVIDSQVGKNF